MTYYYANRFEEVRAQGTYATDPDYPGDRLVDSMYADERGDDEFHPARRRHLWWLPTCPDCGSEAIWTKADDEGKSIIGTHHCCVCLSNANQVNQPKEAL